MKRIKDLHKYLIGIVIGIIIVGSISVYAVTAVIDSKEVTYDNSESGGRFKDVQGSIDELYERSGVMKNKWVDPILNGADPVLGQDMIPVTIADDGTVRYANLYTKWYEYETKRWANAVILVKNPSKTYLTGDIIKEEDIESYFVWVPRYKYKIWDLGNYPYAYNFSDLKDSADVAENNLNALRLITGNAKLIDIVFETKNVPSSTEQAVGKYYTHPAFIAFDVNGLWVGKFETGYNQMDTPGGSISTSGWTTENAQVNEAASSHIIVKPNVYSWRSISIGNMFKNTIEYKSKLNSHMMKNTEWGAAAYLSHSAYGIGTEVNINNNSAYLTGYSAVANTDQNSYPGTNGISDDVTLPYNTPIGYLASTTGNITGIYDMNGCAWEMVAAYMENYGVTTSTGLSSGLKASDLENTIYFDKYSSNSNTRSYNQRILGDATGELGPFYIYYEKNRFLYSHNGWYADYSDFVYPDLPWFVRGGNYKQGIITGQFSFAQTPGPGGDDGAFRLVLAVK